MPLKVNLTIAADLYCPKHPREDGKNPRVSCQSCMAMRRVRDAAALGESNLRQAIHHAVAAGCTVQEGITYSGSNA